MKNIHRQYENEEITIATRDELDWLVLTKQQYNCIVNL